MHELYPELEPFNCFYLKTGHLHSVYVEESGSETGIPVVFLHGGPGAGCSENHRRYFDPGQYRIIIFDQRGANRSVPAACVEENTTQDLIADIEAIRKQLDIDKWLIFGGSWGATLGLLYAQAHPASVSAMILRGTFLARRQDLDWFAGNGANRIFPDFWQDFLAPIPLAEQHDPITAYYKRIHGRDGNECRDAASAWAIWTGRVVTYLLPGADPYSYKPEDIEKNIKEVKIETHYAKHKYFIAENQILNNIRKIPDVPVQIIHGRNDLTCTLDSSWVLHRALPQSEITIVDQGGHLAGVPVMVDALLKATDSMVSRIL